MQIKTWTNSWKVHLFDALLLVLSGVQVLVFVLTTLVAGGNGEQGYCVLVME